MIIPCDKKHLSRFSNKSRRFIANNLIKIKPKKKRIRIESIRNFLSDNGLFSYFIFCPYCNEIYFLKSTFSISHIENYENCFICKHGDPLLKSSIIGLEFFFPIQLDDLEKELKKKKSEELWYVEFLRDTNKPSLNKHLIVDMATELEIFFRNLYATLLNIRNLQRKKSLYYRFYEDAKNRFLNFGNINKHFKNDLKIDLKKKLNQDKIRNLNVLLNKRHIIIHNGGRIDSSFKKATNTKQTIGDELKIRDRDIERYYNLVTFIKSRINTIYIRELKKTFYFRINSTIENRTNIILHSHKTKFENEKLEYYELDV